jgi:general secretion pathway protein B
MSYILEALKKAQAERQLGSAPTIHAPVAAAAPESNAVRKPLVAGAAVGGLLAATGLLLWHQQPAQVRDAAPALKVAAVAPPVVDKPVPAPTQPKAIVEKPVPAVSNGHVALVGQADPPEKPATAGKPVTTEKAVTETTAKAAIAKPAAPEFATVAKPAAPEVPTVAKLPAPAPARTAPVAVASNTPAPVQPVAVSAPPANADDALGGANSLPEAVRRELPKVAFGGYMYSPNPADRLVLVDNILRREGEEVGPGLVLEKLLPKGAVMNYRGYRYRVPF